MRRTELYKWLYDAQPMKVRFVQLFRLRNNIRVFGIRSGLKWTLLDFLGLYRIKVIPAVEAKG